MRILSIDPGFKNLGYCIVLFDNSNDINKKGNNNG